MSQDAIVLFDLVGVSTSQDVLLYDLIDSPVKICKVEQTGGMAGVKIKSTQEQNLHRSKI